jgi:non-heme chloroperoxidase
MEIGIDDFARRSDNHWRHVLLDRISLTSFRKEDPMRKLVPALIVLGLSTLIVPAPAQQVPSLPYKAYTVKSADGVALSVQEWGTPSGSEILFIHGFCQSHLSWSRQVKSDLAKEFRMVTFDLRGHGNSDKPLVAEAYQDSRRWADDIDAIIKQVGLRKPVLVGWSYGGRVINDYLAHYGDGGTAGLDYVAATSTTKPSVLGPGNRFRSAMTSEDLATIIDATQKFLISCFKIQPSAEDMATALAFNMMVPPKVRGFLSGRPANYDDVLSRVKVPVLVTQGREDEVVLPAMSEHTLSVVKHAKGVFYDGVGHSPFYEVSDRFNADLTAFVRSAPR